MQSACKEIVQGLPGCDQFPLACLESLLIELVLKTESLLKLREVRRLLEILPPTSFGDIDLKFELAGLRLAKFLSPEIFVVEECLLLDDLLLEFSL